MANKIPPPDLSGTTRFYNGVEVDGLGLIPNKFIDRELWERLPRNLDQPTVTVDRVKVLRDPMEENDGE